MINQPHEIVFTTTPDFLSIKKANPPYYYSERRGVDSVAVFLVNTNKQVLIRYQPLPPIDDGRLFACPITGTMEPNMSPLQVARKEVKEETGYTVEGLMPLDLGTYIVGTQTNERVHMFAWDVTFLEPEIPEGDGTVHEAMSENGWLDFDAAFEVAEYSGLLIGLFLLRQRGLI